MIPAHTVKTIRNSIELISLKVKNHSNPFEIKTTSKDEGPPVRERIIPEKMIYKVKSFKVGDDILSLRGEDVLFEGIDSSIDIPIILSSCILRNIKGEHCIRIGPTRTTIILENVSNGTSVYCCGQQIRLYKCSRISLFVFSLTGVIMEDCNDISIKEIGSSWYSGMNDDMSCLDFFKNNIFVSDFSQI